MAKWNDKVAVEPLESVNITHILPDDELKKIGHQVIEDFDTDKKSRSTWDESRKNWLRLFMNQPKEAKKNFPWEGCANVVLPIITTAVIQFQSRAYEALLPAKEKLKVNYTGTEDALRAERVAKHMNHQIDYQMEDFEGGWDVSLTQLPINGSIFRKTFFNPLKKRNESIYCSVEDVVVPYATNPVADPRRISHILRLTKQEMIEREALNIFSGVSSYAPDDDKRELSSGNSGTTAIVGSDLRQEMDRLQGIVPPQDTIDTERMVIEQHRKWDLDGDGIEEAYVFTVDYDTKRVHRIIKRHIDGREINYFTHYYFFPNPEGYYGLGFGHILEGVNESASSILNQIIDAGTLANLVAGFYNKRSGIKKGDIEFAMGQLKGVDMSTDDVKKAIMLLDFKGPSTVLFSVLGLLQDYATKVTTVSEAMTGELPSSDTPASLGLATIEQGMKVFSTIHKRIHRTFKKEIRKLYNLNFLFADPNEYKQILGEAYMAQMQQQQIEVDVKADYMGFNDIQPVSDPNITSRSEKLMKAEHVLAKTMANPFTAQNQQAVYEANKRFFKALEVENIESLLPPPEEPPDLTPQEEHAEFLQERGVQALQHQDHKQHIVEHDIFMETQYAEELTPQGKLVFEVHMRQHLAMKYLQEEGEGGAI